MKKDVYFEDFVVELYKSIQEAAKLGKSIEVKIAAIDCKTWSDENITNIECS